MLLGGSRLWSYQGSFASTEIKPNTAPVTVRRASVPSQVKPAFVGGLVRSTLIPNHVAEWAIILALGQVITITCFPETVSAADSTVASVAEEAASPPLPATVPFVTCDTT